MNPQPFYTSKTFWTSSIAFVTLLYYMWSTGHWDATLIGADLLSVLSTVFRWNSDQPLSLTGGVKNDPPPGPSAITRLTKD